VLLLACAPKEDESGARVLSATQERFIEVRGEPNVFTVAFTSHHVAADGAVTPLDPPRRAELWEWVGTDPRRTVFDAGFFVAEGVPQVQSALPPPPLSPRDLHGAMGPSDVEALLGPGQTRSDHLQSAGDVTTLRYHDATVPSSFVFSGGTLVGAVVGFAYDLEVAP
jgi:hypothetical protein